MGNDTCNFEIKAEVKYYIYIVTTLRKRTRFAKIKQLKNTIIRWSVVLIITLQKHFSNV